jgi:hypothetical protein
MKRFVSILFQPDNLLMSQINLQKQLINVYNIIIEFIRWIPHQKDNQLLYQ